MVIKFLLMFYNKKKNNNYKNKGRYHGLKHSPEI